MPERVRSGHSPTRCPYCRDRLEGKDLVACAGCGARHHQGCYREHGACASCGDTDVLVPERSPVAASRPPAGSKIEVVEADGRTTLRWKAPETPLIGKLVLGALFLVGLPLALPLLLVAWWKRKDLPPPPRDADGHELREFVLTPDLLHLRLDTGWALVPRAVTRAQLGKVLVTSVGEHGQWQLAADLGLKRRVLAVAQRDGLSPRELDWLAERLQAWRDEA